MQLVEHDDGGAPVVVDQPPEVRRGALQRVQGHDEGCTPRVALQGNQNSVPRHCQASATDCPPALPTTALPPKDQAASKGPIWRLASN